MGDVWEHSRSHVLEVAFDVTLTNKLGVVRVVLTALLTCADRPRGCGDQSGRGERASQVGVDEPGRIRAGTRSVTGLAEVARILGSAWVDEERA